MNNNFSFDIFIFAGEPSGDLHGSILIKKLLQLNPSLRIKAVSGPKMKKFPIKTLMNTESFFVMGFIDIIFAIPKLLKNYFFLKKELLKNPSKVAIFIDYPGFNLFLEKNLKKNNFPGKLIHYISPTVWAWKKKRTITMAKSLDLLLTIFPFEPKHFSHTTLSTKYVGHPLLEAILPISTKEKKWIGLFPGSRKKEIIRNLPLQLQILEKIYKKNPKLSFYLSLSHKSFEDEIINKTLKSYPHFHQSLKIIDAKNNYEMMTKTIFAIATSGTITLELALHLVPTCVTFAIKPLDLFIAQKILKINLPHYSIVNILLEKEVFPELFGPNFTCDNLFFHCQELLHNHIKRQAIIKDCEELKKLLKADNTAAKEIINQIDKTILSSHCSGK